MIILANGEIMNKPLLAIVIPCYNEELCIKETVEKLFTVINDLINKNKIQPESYLYLVDDGSKDSTWNIIEELHKNNPLVKGQKFIKNYGNQKALIAGLEAVKNIGCDCVVTIDADLQQDEWTIEQFIDKYMEGFDVVSGIRNNRKTDSFFKKFTALAFYKTMNLLGANIPVNHSDYRLVSNHALDIMARYDERYLFLRGFFNDVGFKTAYVNFDVKPRMHGESKFNFRSLSILALNGITSYSVVPLRLVSLLGFAMTIISIILGSVAVCNKIFFAHLQHEWVIDFIMSCFFGGIEMFCLGTIGEYIGQIFLEVKGRPRYIKDTELK